MSRQKVVRLSHDLVQLEPLSRRHLFFTAGKQVQKLPLVLAALIGLYAQKDRRRPSPLQASSSRHLRNTGSGGCDEPHRRGLGQGLDGRH